jgi:hypothetical protein
MLRLLALLLGLVGPGLAQAHDTWFERGPDGGLLLGTGNRFPQQETRVAPDLLVRQGCNAGGCWAQTTVFALTLDPALIPAYLDEVRPPAETLAAWQRLRARGLPWNEHYTKHARIVLESGAAALAAAAAPSGMDMDVLLTADAPPRRGRPLTLQVLRDGRPLPHFAVELRNDRSGIGLWRRTDADGRLVFTPPLAAQWLLRGIDLRLASDDATRWDSRFVTLAFPVVD